MKHFGDITKLSGYELPIVDVITGGSPCQDLSVAGKRAGLDGERSGLFMEQTRKAKRDSKQTRRVIRHLATALPFLSGSGYSAEFRHNMNDRQRLVACLTASVVFRFVGNGATERGRQSGQARLKNSR